MCTLNYLPNNKSICRICPKNVMYAHNWWPKHKKLLWMADNCSEKVKEIKCAIIVWVDRIAGAAGKCSWQNCPLTFSIHLYDVLVWDESEACNNCLVRDSRDAVAPTLAFYLTQELFGGPPWASWKERRDSRSQTTFVFPAICLALKWILNFRDAKTNIRTNYIKSATAWLSIINKTLWFDNVWPQISTAITMGNNSFTVMWHLSFPTIVHVENFKFQITILIRNNYWLTSKVSSCGKIGCQKCFYLQ